VVTFDTLEIAASRKSSEWDENIVRQCNDITMSVNEGGLVAFVVGFHNRYQQWRFHINSAVKTEDGGEAFLNIVLQGGVLGHDSLEIINKTMARPRR
jgi:hypothetical protein